MAAKDKLIGIVLIIVGAFPLLMAIESIKTSLSSYTFLTYLIPEKVAILYQVIIILLGVMLVWTMQQRVRVR
jgi:hypothetical protein